MNKLMRNVMRAERLRRERQRDVDFSRVIRNWSLGYGAGLRKGRDLAGAEIVKATAAQTIKTFDRIRAICEDGERSGADRLDQIYAIVTGDPHHG